MRRGRSAAVLPALLLLPAVLILFLALFAGCGGQDGMLERLSPEQKIGQMLLVGFEGTSLTPELTRLFEDVHPGGVVLFSRNIVDEAQLKKLISDLQGLSLADSALPLFVAVDQEGGEVVRIPWIDDGVSQARIGGPQQAYEAGLARARSLHDLGINLNLAPVLDMGAAGDFLTRYGRAFTGSPREVGELGKGAISGQRDGGVLSAAKHFPGYGGIDYDPENERLAVVPGVPETGQFEASAEAGPAFVMTANVIYSDLDAERPFTLSPAGIDFLRARVPGDYLVVSDDLASRVLKETYTLAGAVTRAAAAGVDVLLVSGHEEGDVRAAFEALAAAVEDGTLARDGIDARVGRILARKLSL